MLLTLLSAVIAWVILWVGGAPTLLIVFGGMGIFQIAFFLLVTFRWKISGHGTAISSLAVLVISQFGGPAAPAALAIPLVAWARIRLQRHTPLQTLAGSVAGIIFMLIVLYLINLNCHNFNALCQ
jgi:membrane-associated phospholipid phosphatase